MSTINKLAWETYKKYSFESWIIGLLSGLLISVFIGLSFLSPALLIFVIPFLCLPILFAAHVSHLGLRYSGSLTFSNTIKQFITYFRSPFSSSFGFFSSLFKTILVFIISQTIISTFGYYIAIAINPGVIESMNQFKDMAINLNEVSADALNELLMANNNALLLYIGIVEVPSFAISFIFFIYFISRNSIGIYLRFNIPSNNPQFIKAVQIDTTRRNRGQMFKDYWSLNWPLYLLLVIGASVGGIGFAFIRSEPEYSLAASLTLASLLSSFYLPFYLNNMCALYDKYHQSFKNSSQIISKMILNNIQTNIQDNIKEMEELQKQLEEESNRIKKEEDKEKDPNDFGS